MTEARAFVEALLSSPVWPADEDIPVPRETLRALISSDHDCEWKQQVDDADNTSVELSNRLLRCQEAQDPLHDWLEALSFVEPGQELFINRGGVSWYANIRHQRGYVVWYMPGHTPQAALSNLVAALTKRGLPQHDVKGEFTHAVEGGEL